VSAWRIAMLAAGLAALAAGLALGLPSLLSGDHDEYGRIDIPPGEGVVALPDGEVVVFYEEARAISTDQAAPEPEVDWQISPEDGGEGLPLDGDGGRESNVREQRAWTDIETLDIPEAGPYEVVVRDVGAGGPDPTLTFGSSGVTSGALALTIGGIAIGSLLITLAFVLGRRAEKSAEQAQAGD
jgi:hypothetical protein